MSKELLFTVTKNDCEWSFTRGTGKGGQKKNKTSSAVHCSHRPSGAHAYSEETRSQSKNKEIAFKKMSETKEFRKWIKLESAKRMGILKQVEEEVERQMRHVKVEVKEKGKWVDESL